VAAPKNHPVMYDSVVASSKVELGTFLSCTAMVFDVAISRNMR